MSSRTDETINHIAIEDIIGSEDVFIEKFVELIGSMLNRKGVSINEKWSLKITRVKSFGVLLYRQNIL